MAIQYQAGRFVFERASGHKQHRRTLVEFNGIVNTPQALITGFHIQFDNADGTPRDRPLHELEIDLDTQINTDPHDTRRNRSVVVASDFGLRDASEHYDDPYSGWIEYVVIADVEA